jgi:hypothetical protein
MARDGQVDAVWQKRIEPFGRIEEKTQEPLKYIASLGKHKYRVLPQVAEANTPRSMDVAGEPLLYD